MASYAFCTLHMRNDSTGSIWRMKQTYFCASQSTFVSKMSSKSSVFNWYQGHCLYVGKLGECWPLALLWGNQWSNSMQMLLKSLTMWSETCCFPRTTCLWSQAGRGWLLTCFTWVCPTYSEEEYKSLLISRCSDYDGKSVPSQFRKKQLLGQYDRFLQWIQHRVGTDGWLEGNGRGRAKIWFTWRVMVSSGGKGHTWRGTGLTRWSSVILNMVLSQGEGSAVLGKAACHWKVYYFLLALWLPECYWCSVLF